MRALTGSLEQLEASALLRLVAAIRPTGVLELDTAQGSLRLEIVDGRAVRPEPALLRRAVAVLTSDGGSFRFEPRELARSDRETVDLTALLDAAQAVEETPEGGPPIDDVEVERLLAGEIFDLSKPDISAIHVLPQAPLENPLDELLADLERTAPQELLLAQIGVITTDPRLWTGPLGSACSRRGWRLHVVASADELPADNLDVVVVHHQLAVSRAGREDEWLELVRRLSAADTPVVWVGPLGDASWIHRVVEAGVAFVLPPPVAGTGDPTQRFNASLCRVIDRMLMRPNASSEHEPPGSVADLVDTLLHGADADQALSSLLQLASGNLNRAAVILVDETAFRLRAGFGYPLGPARAALPRGVGVLERIVRSGAAAEGLDPEAGGAVQLAQMLGVHRLPQATCVIPLGSGGSIVGLLVGDSEGRDLPDLHALTVLARRLGGLVVSA